MNLVMQHNMENYIKGNNMGLNVFKDYKCWSNKYRLTHPWAVVAAGWRNLQAAWQRATRGYADRDVWNLDDWFLQVFPAALKNLAHNSHGFPGHDEMDTYEKWTLFLYKLAQDFETCQDSEGDADNEYYKDYMKSLENIEYEYTEDGALARKTNTEHNELFKKYYERAKELYTQRQELLDDCFKRTSKWLRAMWD